jgi:hypothetical protein
MGVVGECQYVLLSVTAPPHLLTVSIKREELETQNMKTEKKNWYSY